MKKILIALISIFVFVQTFIGISYGVMAIGIQSPLSGRNYVASNLEQTELWIGGYGTIEFAFFGPYREIGAPEEGKTLRIPMSSAPIFGLEFRGGRIISLEGKETRDILREYRNSGNVVCVLLKYYFPVTPESRIHLHVDVGPQISMLTKEEKESGVYKKIGDFTNFWFTAPVGFDYDITKSKLIKFTTLFSFQYSIISSPTAKSTTINYAIGVGVKRCFK